MNGADTHAFAHDLMDRVWRKLDSTHVEDFYHRDVIGHHDSSRGLRYDDVVHRLDWDSTTFTDPVYDIADLIAGDDRFAIRFHYAATLIAEFWLLANVDFDYKE